MTSSTVASLINLLGLQQDRLSARIVVPSMDLPHYSLSIRDLSGGRRLLSDDVAMLQVPLEACEVQAGCLVVGRVMGRDPAKDLALHDIPDRCRAT